MEEMGALVRIVAAFQEAGWQITSVDFRVNPSADNSIALLPDLSFEATAVHVAAELDRISNGAKVDVIVNVAGGWAGGNLLDDDLLKNVSLMISQSVNSSVITAKLSATHLKDDGLLLLVGADAAKEGTPSMIAYGIAKAGVHQLVKSIAASGSGFPVAATVVAILPVTLDTPLNRKFMPDADTSAWTPLQHLAEKILRWADKTETVVSGSLLRVLTKDGSTDVRSKYLKSLPMGTVYKDPRNNHIYKVDEKKINSTLSKVGVPYFGSEEAITIDVPEKHLKLENPVRFNVNQSLKERINELEQTIIQLRSESFSDESQQPLPSKEDEIKKTPTKYDDIIKLMEGREYFDTDREAFEIEPKARLVLYSKKAEGQDHNKILSRLREQLWTDTNVIDELTRNQPAIQKKLLKHLQLEAANQRVVSFKRRKSPVLK
ncbi:hypothetical protein HK100_002743 [Physocladia obscura]|uniref:Dihydropteridine reductase n=1 Tax=Physocladia obscura TaxID=109957 RepID=A0AAD5SUX9_9FUNG|nr:hypothetical protein HK100_002743 [Physocladia obscura]